MQQYALQIRGEAVEKCFPDFIGLAYLLFSLAGTCKNNREYTAREACA